ncbi:hypothetical protein [Niveispirillum sp. BGYR6]|uniref:hypothetical protein n=1 Tax=Niveispirillum sp. BGYR6 TaxID=2971249 RepID=UPI0022B992D2|nr:hypothetical protein [Niveispirillum sp. BGYR6]MDG5497302.1 hypothetical protein [Niveispirillum sp. BGYR6]
MKKWFFDRYFFYQKHMVSDFPAVLFVLLTIQFRPGMRIVEYQTNCRLQCSSFFSIFLEALVMPICDDFDSSHLGGTAMATAWLVTHEAKPTELAPALADFVQKLSVLIKATGY